MVLDLLMCIYLWFKCDGHVTGQPSRHGPRGVKIHRHKIPQFWRHPHQAAAVDGVGHIGDGEPLLQTLAGFKVLEDCLWWLTSEGATL